MATNKYRASGKTTATVNRVCTPEDLNRITILRARGRTWPEIAADRNASISQVLGWFQTRIEPVWKALSGRHVHEELAKLNEIERECWLQYEASATAAAVDPLAVLKSLKLSKGQTREIKDLLATMKPTGAKMAWLTTIMAVIDLRCRLRGDFAPSKSQMTIDTSVRVAGASPAQVNEEMLARLIAKVEERRRYEAALKQAEGSRN